MISKMNYLLLSTMMIVAIDSTFGRGCDCCKKLCADQDSSESCIKSENNKIVNDELITKNEKQNNDPNEGVGDEEKKTLYFAKIDKAGQGDGIKKCFNEPWYNERQDTVLLLKQVNGDGKGLLKVTGSDNEWKITDQGKVLENTDCNPNNNKWIIVKVTTLQDGSEGAGDSFVFYVDDIKAVYAYGVFYYVKCYSIKIIAANTRAVESMSDMFFETISALEKDMKEDTGPGLIGLDKLNVENVTIISYMFSKAIYKQITLKQLEKWRFGKSKVWVTNLFYSAVKGLNFDVLNDWGKSKNNENISFRIDINLTKESVFINDNMGNEFTAPSWYDNIKDRE